MRFFGTLKFFNADRGFGFISRDDGQGDVFIGEREFDAAGLDEADRGEALSFDIIERRDGKTSAVRIERVGKLSDAKSEEVFGAAR